MKFLWLKIIPFATCLMLFAACSTTMKLGNVQVAVTGYHATADATQARVTLRFTNENIFALAIAETSGKLYLNNTYVGQFKLTVPIGVPQVSGVNRDAVLTVENVAYVQQLSANAEAPSISYRLESVMKLEVSEDHAKIETVSSGQIEQPSFRAEPVKAP
jgi:LEA14-like dessication related protein